MPQAGREAQGPSHCANKPCLEVREPVRAPETAQEVPAATTDRALAAEGRTARAHGGRTTDTLCLASCFANAGVLRNSMTAAKRDNRGMQFLWLTDAGALTATAPTAATVVAGTLCNEASVRLWGITFDMSGM